MREILAPRNTADALDVLSNDIVDAALAVPTTTQNNASMVLCFRTRVIIRSRAQASAIGHEKSVASHAMVLEVGS